MFCQVWSSAGQWDVWAEGFKIAVLCARNLKSDINWIEDACDVGTNYSCTRSLTDFMAVAPVHDFSTQWQLAAVSLGTGFFLQYITGCCQRCLSLHQPNLSQYGGKEAWKIVRWIWRVVMLNCTSNGWAMRSYTFFLVQVRIVDGLQPKGDYAFAKYNKVPPLAKQYVLWPNHICKFCFLSLKAWFWFPFCPGCGWYTVHRWGVQSITCWSSKYFHYIRYTLVEKFSGFICLASSIEYMVGWLMWVWELFWTHLGLTLTCHCCLLMGFALCACFISWKIMNHAGGSYKALLAILIFLHHYCLLEYSWCCTCFIPRMLWPIR